MINEQLLEYLYGEMDEKQRVIFEQSLQTDHALQRELSELKMVRNFLDHSIDEKTESTQIVVQRPKLVRPISKWWVVAASVLMLLIAGKLLDLNINWQDNQMTIAFGQSHAHQSTQTKETITPVEYLELKTGMESLKAQLSAFRLEQKSDQISAPQTISSGSKDDDRAQLVQLIQKALEDQQDNLETRLSNQILEEQQIYIQSIAQDLIRYWDEQRQNDLEVINDGLQNLAQSIQFSNNDLVQLVNNPRQNY
jgi:hypothetical protein